MTPLEKAKSAEGRVNYCDECEQFKIVGNACYCKVDGKLINPIMLARGQGTGPAWNCKKRIKPITNYEKLIRKTPEELADILSMQGVVSPPWCTENYDCPYADQDPVRCDLCALNWLRKEAE